LFDIKTKLMKNSLIALMFVCVCANATLADSLIKPQPRSSQLVLSTLLSADAYIKVTYGQPLKRNRPIFGALVPYGKLWRTGANEATEMTFTSNVNFGTAQLPAGTYTLFSIPDAKDWTIIVNSKLGQWGDTQYDSTFNVASFKIPVAKSENIYEGFTIALDKKTDNELNMNLLWDMVQITIPMWINPKEAVISEKKKKWWQKKA
jgi:hypothetical protein